MTEGSSSTGAGRGQRRSSAWYVLVPAVALVLGLVLGGLLVWVGKDPGVAPTDPATTSQTPEPVEPSQAGTAVVVPDACLEAADSAREAVDAIQKGVGSVRNFNGDEIIDLLDRLEDIDARVRDQVATCRETEVTDAPLETESVSPEVEDSATP